MNRFEVGIVGAGTVVNELHLPVLLNMPQVRVAWIADIDADKAASAADAYGLPRAVSAGDLAELPPCDVALMAVPVGVRRPYLDLFASRGTAVLAEKPFARTAVEHEGFERPFAEPRIGCGFVRRMYESSSLLRRIVDEGWFGALERIVVVESKLVMKTGIEATYLDLSAQEGGGFLLDVGCHGLDLAFFITRARSFELLERNVTWDGPTDRATFARLRLGVLGGRAGSSCELVYRGGWIGPMEGRVELEFSRVRASTGITAQTPVRIEGRDGSHPGEALTVHPGQRGARTVNQAAYLEWDGFLTGVGRNVVSSLAASTCRLTTAAVEQILAGTA